MYTHNQKMYSCTLQVYSSQNEKVHQTRANAPQNSTSVLMRSGKRSVVQD